MLVVFAPVEDVEDVELFPEVDELVDVEPVELDVDPEVEVVDEPLHPTPAAAACAAFWYPDVEVVDDVEPVEVDDVEPEVEDVEDVPDVDVVPVVAIGSPLTFHSPSI